MTAVNERLPTPAGSGFAPDTDILWAKGRQAELLTVDLLVALQEGNVEVKNDSRARDRIFVEYACRWSDGEWHNSGIMDTAAETWLFVVRDYLLVAVPVWTLREMVSRIIKTNHRARRHAPNDWGLVEKPQGRGDEWPTRGVVIPLRGFIPWTCRVVEGV